MRTSDGHTLNLNEVPKEALERLATNYPEEAEIVKLQIFGGPCLAEIAEVSGMTAAEVEQRLGFARAILPHTLSRRK